MRLRLDALAATSSGRAISDWSPSPQPLLKQATERYLESGASYRNCDDFGQDLVTASTQRPFQPELIRAKITKVMESIPFDEDQGAYTSRNPLICRLRSFIRTRAVGCSLCAFYDRGPIIETHKLKSCSHRGEAGEARPWLEMFRRYRVCGGGLGARCTHCRFPLMLCWRTAYSEEMDLKYG
ncbi:hypothetical protein FOXYSP1_19571 [Fusarium oxysporum f. sp. phaseoli]